MILLSLALGAAQVPPAPSGIALPPGAVEIVDPIADAVGRYDRCISDGFHAKHPVGISDPARHRREMVKAIERCTEVRRDAVAEAERALSVAPDYRDPVKREAAIRHAFEGTQEMRREFAAHAAAGDYTTPTTVTAPEVRVPEGTMPAVARYLGCFSNGLNRALREKITSREAREERAAAIDTACREDAVKALPRFSHGRITSLNGRALTGFHKAMDQLGASIREGFVDPDGYFRRRQAAAAAENGNPNASNR